MSLVPWFERRFMFDVPIEIFPNIIERLRGTPARLEDRLLVLPGEMLTRKSGNKWSIQEHAGHLLDLAPLDLGRLDDFREGANVLRAADLQNRLTFEANHNSRALTELLRDFRKERTEFVHHLENLDDEFLARTATHPRLCQSMRVLDFALFIAEHDDHHLASMTALLNLQR